MIWLGKLSIRHPKSALAAWLAIAAALTLIGLGVSGSLSPSITVVPGTQSSRAEQLANAAFGPSQLVPILLEGPTRQLNSAGPALVTALRRRPDTRVLSAWDAGTASAGLRPRPTAAMIVVAVDRSEKAVVGSDEPQIEHLVSSLVRPPVRAFVTGQPSIDRALRSASVSSLRGTELLAVGILFVLLLIGLRAPLAALIVTAVGAISMLSGFGEVTLLGHLLTLDPVGVALGTMTGLALGTAFALVIVDRFHREEPSPGASHAEVASAALRELETAGKAVLVGGTAVVLALAIVAVIGPTALLVSLGTGMLVCAAFAIGGAVVVMPAALVLLGHRISAWSFPPPRPLARAWSRLEDAGGWVTRRAVYVGFVATALLAALAVPAFALHSGPPDVSQLPADSKARIAFEEVSRVMGPGWATPFDVIVVARNRPVTTPALLAGIGRFERQIADNGTVYSVEGPGELGATSNQLKTFGPQLKHSMVISDQSKKNLLELIDGLGEAGSGSKTLQAGLASASSGASKLHAGGGQAQSGAGQLHAGLAQAHSGSAELAAGLRSALAGATALKNGAGKALSGSTQLSTGLRKAAPQVKAGLPAVGQMANASAATDSQIKSVQSDTQSAQSEVSSALSALNASAAKGDPGVTQALDALGRASDTLGSISSALTTAGQNAATTAFLAAGVDSQIKELSPGLTQAASGASQLQAGIKQLHAGNAQLATGLDKLTAGGSQLTGGLSQLTTGAGALQVGIGQLTNGAGELATGLSGGVGPAGQLTTGLGTMQAAVIKARGQIPSTAQLKQLEAQSPGIFSSGYFVLSAIAGATASNRNAATFTINLLRGGTAGQIVVVSRYPASDPRTAALGTALANLGRRFATQQNAQVAVGGPGGSLEDLTSVTKSRLPLDVAIIVFATALMLGLAMRAVLLPAVATLFSMLVTAATYGLLQILFGGSEPVLGGPGYLDPMTIIGTFSVAFPVTIVFSTLLLMRAREAFLSSGIPKYATMVALNETAAAATGAGLVMIAALIPFATTDLLNVRAFGIGVATSILLAVFVVRPVLLPAAIAVLGRLGWWPTRATSNEPAPLGRPGLTPRSSEAST